MNKLFFLSASLVLSLACNKVEKPTIKTAESVTQVAPQVQEIPAKVVIEIYSDYQCPACANYHSLLKQLKQEYGSEIRIDIKHFPLVKHPYSHVAARAAEAARVQGKFEPMNELIFAGQKQWGAGNAEAIFAEYATSMELDVEKFKTDMNSADMNRIVMANRREGVEIGLRATPTLVINGEKIENNPATYPLLKERVESYMD